MTFFSGEEKNLQNFYVFTLDFVYQKLLKSVNFTMRYSHVKLWMVFAQMKKRFPKNKKNVKNVKKTRKNKNACKR